MNKKTLFFLVNIPVWITVLAITYFVSFYRYLHPPHGFQNFSGIPEVIGYSFMLVLTLLVPFYIFYSFLVPKYLLKNKNRIFWIYAILFIFIGNLLLSSLIFELYYFIFNKGSFIFNNVLSYSKDPQELILSYLMSCGFGIICFFLGTICRLSVDSVNNLQQKKDLENKNLMSEIKVIKSKLNPHLLFNTFNNIDTLIQIDPKKASDSLSKLSDILRYVVYDTENENIPIENEIEIIRKYIDLERLRMINPDVISFSTEISDNVNIPPMIFFPFVENGFKHSNLNKPGQKISITISSKNETIIFTCLNTINDVKQNYEKKGIGLDLAIKRLELLYPDRHKLDINQENNEFSITLQINLQK